MDIVIKAAAIAVIAVMCILLISKSNGEISLAAALTVTAVICISAVQMLADIADLIKYAISLAGLGGAVFMPILKCAGIAIVVHIGAGLCKDAGQSSIAASLELVGSAAALFTALPLMRSLLDTIGGLI